jgi:hypothetical protein
MRRLDASDLKEMQLFKYYRLVRKWACKSYGLKDADLELLIYLDCCGTFQKSDFINGVFTYSWDKRRWNRLLKEGWIKVWRRYNLKKGQSRNIYEVSQKTKLMIKRIYRILLGEEDMPIGHRSVFYKNKTYTDKVYNHAIDQMIKDPDR